MVDREASCNRVTEEHPRSDARKPVGRRGPRAAPPSRSCPSPCAGWRAARGRSEGRRPRARSRAQRGTRRSSRHPPRTLTTDHEGLERLPPGSLRRRTVSGSREGLLDSGHARAASGGPGDGPPRRVSAHPAGRVRVRAAGDADVERAPARDRATAGGSHARGRSGLRTQRRQRDRPGRARRRTTGRTARARAASRAAGRDADAGERTDQHHPAERMGPPRSAAPLINSQSTPRSAPNPPCPRRSALASHRCHSGVRWSGGHVSHAVQERILSFSRRGSPSLIGVRGSGLRVDELGYFLGGGSPGILRPSLPRGRHDAGRAVQGGFWCRFWCRLGVVIGRRGVNTIESPMHELLVRRFEARGWGHVLFHGRIDAERRGGLVDRFRDDPCCRAFLATDAGGVGLNLQHASVVVNVDLPWNPAVLEQRIGRVPGSVSGGRCGW
jgi:hypothetical protein